VIRRLACVLATTILAGCWLTSCNSPATGSSHTAFQIPDARPYPGSIAYRFNGIQGWRSQSRDYWWSSGQYGLQSGVLSPGLLKWYGDELSAQGWKTVVASSDKVRFVRNDRVIEVFVVRTDSGVVVYDISESSGGAVAKLP
jgi:hypothetical protein